MRDLMVFAGCSFTAGHGWNPDDAGAPAKEHPDLWCNQIRGADRSVNVAIGGASNREIFREAVFAICEHWDQVSLLLVEWTSMPRYRLDLGLEEWHTGESLQNRQRQDEISLIDHRWNRHEVNDVINRFLDLHHLHPEICDLIAMIKCLRQLCDRAGAGLVCINGLCPWDDGYFDHQTAPDRLPSDFTPFTRNSILKSDLRDDEQIFRLYDRIHDNYYRLGTIQQNLWANLYSSFQHLQVDHNHDQQHPGKLSNQIYARLVNNFLESTGI